MVKEKDPMDVVKFDDKKVDLPPPKEEKKNFILNRKNTDTIDLKKGVW